MPQNVRQCWCFKLTILATSTSPAVLRPAGCSAIEAEAAIRLGNVVRDVDIAFGFGCLCQGVGFGEQGAYPC